jgi:hypothetical protein
VVCVVVRRGSYGSQDPTRKGGSDEGMDKPEKRACGELDTEGCIFFPAMYVPYCRQQFSVLSEGD